jgi:hypothetical protein
MNEPGLSGVQLFELPDEKPWFMKLSLGARAASAFLIALLLVGLILIPIVYWPSAALRYSPLAGLIGVLLLTGFFVSLVMRPRISKVRISSEGLGLVDSNGRVSVQAWTDPSFGLTLMDHSKEARASPAARKNIELWSSKKSRGWIPPELAAKITKEARLRGLPVAIQDERALRGRTAAILVPTTRIGRPESTPLYRPFGEIKSR